MKSLMLSRLNAKLDRRLNGLKNIDPNLELGEGLTVAVLETKIKEFKVMLDDYNLTLVENETKRSKVRAMEPVMGDLAEWILHAVSTKFGNNSAEYTSAGGVRKSERKKPVKRASSPGTNANS
jgi:hypothetical protein